MDNSKPAIKSALDWQYPPPPISDWPNAPVLITNPSCEGGVVTRSVVPLHRPGPNPESEFPIDSSLFCGKAYIAIKGIENYPEKYFSGKRRLFNVVVQGCFQRPDISFASVQTGQIFSAPLHLMPPTFLLNPFRYLLERLQPSLSMNLEVPKPYVLSPLMSTMQAISVSRQGEENSISSNSDLTEEDLSLLDPEFKEMSSSDRKTYFSKKENLNKYYFDPSFVYTFNFYQDLLDMSTFEVALGFARIDISRFLGPLPISIMAAVVDLGEGRVDEIEPEYLYHLEVWHEKSFQYHS